MDKRVFYLVHEAAREGARKCLEESPDGYRVVFSAPTRSPRQSDQFHAICSDLERSGFEWAGKARSKEEWKVLLISAHAKATGVYAEIVKGIEGELVSIREATAAMSRQRASSLIEYSLAFCAENGVLLGEFESVSGSLEKLIKK